MSRTGNCYDNAPMKSFFHTLKVELVHQCRWATQAEARQALLRSDRLSLQRSHARKKSLRSSDDRVRLAAFVAANQLLRAVSDQSAS